MNSCASINDEVITKYNELILGHISKGIIIKFSDDFKEVVFEDSFNGESFEDYINKFPQDDCRYGVYDFSYMDNKENKKNKIFFISWCPVETKIKNKIVHTATEQSIYKKLVGIDAIIKATDNTEISQSLVEERCK
ncbi:hypothetical protein DDB_G0283367 [Dictyostelium discoideum AX4]|uniref:Cofilin-4 n=1 Tax=Dictyostelium discoideum TaxID=44689 RepID=COF4_DICDI|nr:hypothetical protein DDB_G0283367 [Dictyostelium discoideum AX4]Q54R65.1 RecName: Full=Cofilin-4 [Dictyostelium discoideum]EAL65760.1 hypothetical protein DDB_G0283367 [Dictyostelium discoideum AX4]|eukprot:XP_639118.1 hypothetical protein DDB_G0283367 [Dictyostelium discoideum AX4]